MCESIVGFLPIDGGIMAIFRYIRCIFQTAFGGGALFDGLIILVSVLWQLSKPIINVIAGAILLILKLFVNPGGPFDFLNTVVGFFSSFSALFNGGLITTSAADPFVRRMQDHLSRSGFSQHGTVLTGLQHVFMGYTMDDCRNDLRVCLNRNFGMTCEDSACTTAELTAMFNGTTPCDYVVREANMASLAERTEFLYCIERRLIGERVRAYLYPNFPAASFYTGWQFIPALLKEINDGFTRGYDYNAFPMPEEDMDNTALNEELERRAARIRAQFGGNSDRVIRLDAMEYKLRSGYYTKLLKRAANRARMSRDKFAYTSWRADAWDFGKTVGRSAYEIADIIVSNVPDAVSKAFDSFVTAKDILMDTPSLFKQWYAFKAEWYQRVFHAPVAPEDQARRDLYWSYFRQGPVYQWIWGKSDWQGPSWPIVPFVKHLYNVSRVYKASGEPGFWNAYGLGVSW